ncbi:MAG: hypothetical protein AAF721_28795 [Myxococcota bacterium]
MPETRPLPGATRGSGLRRAVLTAAMLGGLVGVPSIVAASVGAGRSMARSVAASMVQASRAASLDAARDDLLKALATAREQFNALELEAALATLDAAVVRAQGAGLANDPSLAPLLVLRGGIIYSTTGDQARTQQAFAEAVAADYNAVLPIELRSEELQAMLEAARQGGTAPGVAVVHEPPKLYAGQDVEIKALAGVPLQDGATLTLYYRAIGSDAEYKPVYLTLYGNLGLTTVPAADHADKGLEYFFYIYDAQNGPLGNYGNQEAPLVLEVSEGAAPAGAGGGGDGGEDDGGDDGTEDKPKKPKKKRGKTTLPRVLINLGVGTGFGIARGTAEQTYQQYTPGLQGALYSPREQACAIERWFAAGGELAPDPLTFQQHLQMIEGQPGAQILPGSATDLAMNYDANYCSARHPVTTGLASAPFHLAPEIGFRLGRAFVLSVFGRLQVVTGSRVFTEDLDKDVAASFNQDIISPAPTGVQQKPPFTFAVGVKGKYFFGRDDAKLRLFAGGFAGYGNTRLRVDMSFSNDRNGNSVPDAQETALHGQADANNDIIPETCVPVWPYNQGCGPSNETMSTVGDLDRNLANGVRQGTPSTDARIDTVVVGPGFAGLLFGFHYQIVNHFAIFAELNAGGWFPNTGSVVFDINLGPSITF